MKRIGMVVVGTLCAFAAFGERTAVVSPDGKNEIRLETEPTLAFQVFRNGRALTERSPMAMMVEGKAKMGGAGLKIVSKQAADRSGTVPSPIYKKASVDETAKGMVVSFGEWSVELIARNDGVAWRYVTDFGDKEVIVKNERIDLTFASGEQTVYATPNYGHGADDPLQNSWEGIYTKHQVKDAPRDPKSAENGLWYAPLTFIYPSGETMVVEESDIWDYPGWNFNGTADGRTLTSLFAAYPKKTVYENWGADSRSDKPLRYQRVLEREDYLARTRGTRTYPWRVFALADNVAKIAESDIVFALASPNAIGDASWVKPGKVAWDWWNNWNLTGVDFRAGINTRTYEYYIDFAAKNGIEYVIFDEGWSQHLDVEKYNPDMDVPHLVRYASERGVGIILWAAWAQFHGRAERVVSKYAQMGVKGFKVDFMDRDDQLCYEFLKDFAALCAKYKMLVDYHGMSKPAGFARTYPNVLCFEGVQGLENLKGKTREFFPAMDCTIAFTRMAAGPLDYTPGAMRNFCKGTYHPHPNTPGSYGTRVHQMALMTVYEAPLEMLCDSPTQYLANRECFDYMRKLPVVWDETIALEGEMDAYATIARRKGADWYVGSICGWQGHETEIDTSFLGKGVWTAEVFADGVNADRDAVDYAHKTLTIRAGEKIPVKLMPGGGWTAHFTRDAVCTRTAQGVVFKGVEVHNVADLVRESDGRYVFRRAGETVHRALGERGRSMNEGNTGVELRFVMKGDSVRLRLGGAQDDSHAKITVYHGDIIGDWPELYKSVHGRDAEVVIQKDAHSLKEIARRRGDRFDPEVVRLVLSGSPIGIRDIIGEVEPPPVSMLPRKTYLAYGSSITHGSNALSIETCYASLVGRGLGADVRNLGFAGSARLEPEVADFIAGESFDYATLEMGINVLDMDLIEFERRVRYFVRRVAESHPLAHILVIDVFGNRMDGESGAKAAAFRGIVRRVVGESDLTNVVYANGLDLLANDIEQSSGGVHPTPNGHAIIAENILRILKPAEAHAQASGLIRPGELWHDTAGHVINAHGGGVLFEEGIYWWYGEHKVYGQEGNRSHVGIHAYSSDDLVNWTDRGIVLPVSGDMRSDIADGCIMERPKVLRSKKTGKFVMYFHLELKGQGYDAARTGIAVADRPEGPFRFVRSLRPTPGTWPTDVREIEKSQELMTASRELGNESGAPSERVKSRVPYLGHIEGGQMSRDMTLFTDEDGKSYHIFASEYNSTLHIAELTDDLLDYTGRWFRMAEMEWTEAPAICKHGGWYFLIGSGCSGWKPNTARLYRSRKLEGPWERLGNPCRGNSEVTGMGPDLTWGGQSTFLLPVSGRPDLVIAMFDVWHPENHEESRYLWLPVTFAEDDLQIDWRSAWSVR